MTDPVFWDPYSHQHQREPYEIWRRLRDEVPLYHNDRYGFYALSRFDDVLSASLDEATFSSAKGITLDTIGTEPDPPSMITMDPPRHDVLRKVVNRAFTPRSIGSLERRIRELCAMYLDPFVGAPGMDFVRDFGARLPVMVISTLLGFPEQDHDQLREWSDEALHREEGQEGPTAKAEEYKKLRTAYILDFIKQRRVDPRDDMISTLIGAALEEPDGTTRALTDLEIMAMIGLISAAGNETVARLLGWVSVVFSENPDQRKILVDDPSLIPNAVEEMLRFEAPSPIQGRYVTRDISLHGTKVPAGSKMALLTGAAGRDERKYADPDRFDVRRDFDRHVSLGYGVHYCLGAALARMEGRVAIGETLKRFPEWHVDRADVEFVATNTVRGPASSPITF